MDSLDNGAQYQTNTCQPLVESVNARMLRRLKPKERWENKQVKFGKNSEAPTTALVPQPVTPDIASSSASAPQKIEMRSVQQVAPPEQPDLELPTQLYPSEGALAPRAPPEQTDAVVSINTIRPTQFMGPNGPQEEFGVPLVCNSLAETLAAAIAQGQRLETSCKGAQGL